MRSKYLRSDSPLISPNLDMVVWAPGAGNQLHHGLGSVGIFDPNSIAVSSFQAGVPFSLANLFDLPTIYQDGSTRYLNIAQEDNVSDAWDGWTVTVIGLDRGHSPAGESHTFTVGTARIDTTTEWSYIIDLTVTPPTPFVAPPINSLYFNPGTRGTSRLFFPDAKSSSWDNSLQVSLSPYTPGNLSFNFNVKGSNIPQNVIKNSGPFTGPQIDESYLQLMYDNSFILPCDGISVPSMATMSDITTPFLAKIPFSINCFWIELKDSGTVVNDNDVTGPIIFNQTSRWFA